MHGNKQKGQVCFPELVTGFSKPHETVLSIIAKPGYLRSIIRGLFHHTRIFQSAVTGSETLSVHCHLPDFMMQCCPLIVYCRQQPQSLTVRTVMSNQEGEVQDQMQNCEQNIDSLADVKIM